MSKRGRPKNQIETPILSNSKNICYVCGKVKSNCIYVGECKWKENGELKTAPLYRCSRAKCYHQIIIGVKKVYMANGVYNYNKELPLYNRFKFIKKHP